MSLGKDKFNDRKNYVEDVKDVDLYKMIPFNCELPGTSQLHISLMDWDLIGALLFFISLYCCWLLLLWDFSIPLHLVSVVIAKFCILSSRFCRW